MTNIKLNHTPDAICNCTALQPRTAKASGLAVTTPSIYALPQTDHLCPRVAYRLAFGGFGL